MERIERHEGESLTLGGYTFAVVHARGGRLIMLANSVLGETAEDCQREARRLRAKLDKEDQKDEDVTN